MFTIITNENQTENILDVIQTNCGYNQTEEGVMVDNLDTNYFIKADIKDMEGRIKSTNEIIEEVNQLQKDIIRVKPHDPTMAKKYGETLRSVEDTLRTYKSKTLKLIQKIKISIPESLEELGMSSFRITIVSPQDQDERKLVEKQKELIQLQKEFENLKREFERINK